MDVDSESFGLALWDGWLMNMGALLADDCPSLDKEATGS